MTFVYKCIISVLSENDTVHAVFFRNVAKNHEIIILQIFDLDPVLRAAVKVIFTVLPLRNNSLKLLLLGKIIKRNSVFLNIP